MSLIWVSWQYDQTYYSVIFACRLFLSRKLNGKGLHFNELQTIKSRDWVDYVKLFYCRKATTIYCVFREKVWNGKPSKINTFLTHRSTMLLLREKLNLEKKAQTMQAWVAAAIGLVKSHWDRKHFRFILLTFLLVLLWINIDIFVNLTMYIIRLTLNTEFYTLWF